MRIKKLTLRNYRGFENLEFEPGQYCVLVGRNGSGKSSVLQALHIMFQNSGPDWRPGSVFPWDFHRGTAHLEFKAEFSTGGVSLAAQAEFFTDRTSGFSWDGLPHARPPLFLSATRSHTVEPLVDLIPWFTAQENLENELRLRGSPEHRMPELEAVREALRRFLAKLPDADYQSPRISRVELGAPSGQGTLVFEKNGETVAIQQLSDGEQVLLLTVMELARKLVIAHPESSSPIDEQGVLLMDEVALHLHPAWQRGVLPALRATFPELQIIATTHSPQVLASVPTHAVKVLQDFQLYASPEPVEGRDSNAILEEIMGVPPRPKHVQERLDSIAAAIDADALAQAQAELEALSQILTERDGEVVRLRVLLEFLAA